MEKITVEMSQREYKKFLAYKEADKIAKSIRKGLLEVEEARVGKLNKVCVHESYKIEST